MWGRNLVSNNRFLRRLQMELAWFSGYARLKQRRTGGAGVILRFERVRPRRPESFQPLKSQEITPDFLDTTIRALKRWRYDVVSMEEACRRAVTLPLPRRFACLTFDGGYKDFITHGYPVLARYGVPFAVYLPTAFPDGVGEAWWLALEDIIAREPRLSLVIERTERHFTIGSASEKYDLYRFLAGHMRTLPPRELSLVAHDLCRRYSVDLAALSRAAAMDWDDLARLAADRNVTIGTATVNHPMLSKLREAEAAREMTMGKMVADTALRRDVRHFAYPFGEPDTFGRRHVVMAKELGFVSAASTIAGVVEAQGRTNLHALPRIAWDGRQRSLRMMRVLLSGWTFAAVPPAYGS